MQNEIGNFPLTSPLAKVGDVKGCARNRDCDGDAKGNSEACGNARSTSSWGLAEIAESAATRGALTVLPVQFRAILISVKI